MTPKNRAAVELGRRGGKATAQKLTPEQRKESARHAAEARWAKLKELVGDINQRSKKLEAAVLRREKARKEKHGKP
jgi:hypothetical protein